MRKIILALIALLIMGGMAFADSDHSENNAVIVGPHMGASGIDPMVELVKVSIGSSDCGASTDDDPDIGDVLVFDLNDRFTDGSGLGYMVRRCDNDTLYATTPGTVLQKELDSGGVVAYAGVLVTKMSSDHLWTTPRGSGRETGYMAIRGFVDANIDVSNSKLGAPLVLNGATLAGSFATITKEEAYRLSHDIGVLLELNAADGLAKVWLR